MDWDSGGESGHGLKPGVPIPLHCPDSPRLTVFILTRYRRLWDTGLHDSENLCFPSQVLSQEDYRQKFGGDRQDPMESGSPFVFVCEHPQELFVKFPIKGLIVKFDLIVEFFIPRWTCSSDFFRDVDWGGCSF